MQSLIDNNRNSNNNINNTAVSKNDFTNIKTWLFVPATRIDRVAKHSPVAQMRLSLI